MTAITLLPPTRPVEVPRLPDKARRGELQRLAADVLDGTCQSHYGVQVHVAALAHPSLPQGTVKKAWRKYLDALRDWQDVKQVKATHPGCSEADLHNWCEATADAALNLLIYGGAR